MTRRRWRLAAAGLVMAAMLLAVLYAERHTILGNDYNVVGGDPGASGQARLSANFYNPKSATLR